MDISFSETLLRCYKQEGYTADIEKDGDDIILHVSSPELQVMGIDAIQKRLTEILKMAVNALKAM